LPLSVLVPLVVVGISGVVLLTWWLGWARPAVLSSAEETAREFLRDYEDQTVLSVALASDGLGALMQLEDGDVGLIFSFGDKFVTRRLTAQMVQSVNLQTTDRGHIVTLSLDDFSAPSVRLVFPSADTVQPMLDQLAPSTRAA
jgi:hypothetical protein